MKETQIIPMEDLSDDEVNRRIEKGERLDTRTVDQRMQAITVEHGEGVFDAYEMETPENAEAMRKEDEEWELERLASLPPQKGEHFSVMHKRNGNRIVEIDDASPLAQLEVATRNLRNARKHLNQSLQSEMRIIPGTPTDHSEHIETLSKCQKEFNETLKFVAEYDGHMIFVDVS